MADYRYNDGYEDGIAAERERWRKALTEPSEELVEHTRRAIGNIETTDSGVIGYPTRLDRKLSAQLLDKLVRAALRAIAEYLAKP